jgi:hypothetical protein
VHGLHLVPPHRRRRAQAVHHHYRTGHDSQA